MIQLILGAIWFLDGILQLQPSMFGQGFLTSTIMPVAEQQPAWIADSIHWTVRLVGAHEPIYNSVFAVIQLVIGFWLMINFRVRLTLSLSFVWVALVWWFGEGFGQLATGKALLLTGAPGAVLLYGLIGVAVWPASDAPAREFGRTGQAIARWSLGLVWLLGAGLQLQPTFRDPAGLGGAFAVPWAGAVVTHATPAVAYILFALELFVGVALLSHRLTRIALSISIVLSLAFWWLGQGFGQLPSGMATDINAGPLMVLLALCAFAASDRTLAGRKRSFAL